VWPDALSRMLATLCLFLEFNDPRKTRNLPEELHTLTLHLLQEPWTLRRYETRNLEGVLECTPGFASAVTAAVSLRPAWAPLLPSAWLVEAVAVAGLLALIRVAWRRLHRSKLEGLNPPRILLLAAAGSKGAERAAEIAATLLRTG
jgi:hypothetical protein